MRFYKIKNAPSTVCTGRWGFKHFSSFEFILLPGRVHARPHTGIPKVRGQGTNLWALVPRESIGDFVQS